MGLSMLSFYGGIGGSMVWVPQVGLTMGIFGEFRV